MRRKMAKNRVWSSKKVCKNVEFIRKVTYIRILFKVIKGRCKF